ncbi:hypothetical protein OG216_09775 [Streptomycetaceae bacterium NBC_01309]
MPDTDPSSDLPACLRHRNRAGDPWCPSCRTGIYDAIGELPDKHAELLTYDGQATRPRQFGGRSSIDPASPSPEYDHADEIQRTLTTWAQAWADHLGETYTGRDPRAAATYLRRHRKRADLLASPLADDLGREMLALHATALRLLGDTAGDEIHSPVGGMCPRCGSTGLYRVLGPDEVIRCPHRDCGHHMDWDEYVTVLEAQAFRRRTVAA